MRINTRVLLAAGCVSLMALSVPAFSRPVSKGQSEARTKAAHSVQAKRAQATVPKRQKSTRALRRQPAPPAAASYAAVTPTRKPLFGWPTLVAEARKYMGTNPTARSRLWCATFMNMVLAKAGYTGTNSDAARSFTSYGRRISEPKVGAIAVLTRGKRGGHVGVVSGIDKQGNPIIISGNHNKRVGEAVYPRSRVIAYVMPNDRGPLPATQVADRGPSGETGQPNMSRAGSGPGIDSPIAELIAAIEAEQARAERTRPAPPPVQAAAPRPPMPAAAQPQAQPRPPQRVVEQLSAAPHRVVQQTAEPPRTLRRDLPLDPALAEFFGVRQGRAR